MQHARRRRRRRHHQRQPPRRPKRCLRVQIEHGHCVEDRRAPSRPSCGRRFVRDSCLCSGATLSRQSAGRRRSPKRVDVRLVHPSQASAPASCARGSSDRQQVEFREICGDGCHWRSESKPYRPPRRGRPVGNARPIIGASRRAPAYRWRGRGQPRQYPPPSECGIELVILPGASRDSPGSNRSDERPRCRPR